MKWNFIEYMRNCSVDNGIPGIIGRNEKKMCYQFTFNAQQGAVSNRLIRGGGQKPQIK